MSGPRDVLNLRVLTEQFYRQKMIGLYPIKEIEAEFQWVRSQVDEYWRERNIEGVMLMFDNQVGLDFVFDNVGQLRAANLYERGLLLAWMDIRTNHLKWHINDIRILFSIADRERLLAAGDKIPNQDTFTLYRGVAGRGRDRRVSGFSWTDNIETAERFSKRFGVEDPAVYTITVPAIDVFAYLNERNESEFILVPPFSPKPRRVQ